jgi:predicted AAA+ superfamily ATPase
MKKQTIKEWMNNNRHKIMPVSNPRHKPNRTIDDIVFITNRQCGKSLNIFKLTRRLLEKDITPREANEIIYANIKTKQERK